MLKRIKAVGSFFMGVGSGLFYLVLVMLAWLALQLVSPFVSKTDKGVQS